MNAIFHFIAHGHRLASQQWSFQIVRGILYTTIVAMWAYVWSMASDEMWRSLDLTWTHIVWYIIIAETVVFVNVNSHRTIELDLREGRFQSHLSRPLSWLRMFYAQEWGYTPINFLIIGSFALALGVFATHTIPFGIVKAIEILVHIILSTLIWANIIICVGMTAMWMGSANFAYWIVQKSGFVFGGLLLPLTLYPAWLKVIAFASPFAAIFYVPAQSILPHPTFGFWAGTAYQLLVLGVSIICTRVIYSRFENKILQDG